MRRSVSASAPGKVNLCLGVGLRRRDGYHALATVYEAIGLRDTVTVHEAEDMSVCVRAEPRLTVDDVPVDGSNIAVRAARLLGEHHGSHRAVEIVIEKSVPVAGGLAGGSADAAATLLACDRLWGRHTAREELLELAAELGSDVPFALLGGTALGQGRGELVTPLPTGGRHWWVVLAAERGLSTPAVYREFDALSDGAVVAAPQVPPALLAALRGDDVTALGAALGNDLQPAALRLRPGLRAVLDRGSCGSVSVHGAILSGSGPSCLFLCGSRPDAVQLAAELSENGLGPAWAVPAPVPGARLVAARTTERG